MRLSVLMLVALGASLSCSSAKKAGPGKKKKDPYATTTDLCEAWGEAACNDGVVSACAAKSVDDCAFRQARVCEAAIPSFEYSSDGAKDCLDAVRAAYEDAKLTVEERRVVRELAQPCDLIAAGGGQDGDTCFEDSDCNKDEGLSCVQRPSDVKGTCRVPQIVGGGFGCAEPYQICEEAFYCDGSNCIARVSQEGAPCSDEVPCASGFQCEGMEGGQTCRAKGGLGADCVSDDDCASDLCLTASGATMGVCASEIILSPTDAICEEFR